MLQDYQLAILKGCGTMWALYAIGKLSKFYSRPVLLKILIKYRWVEKNYVLVSKSNGGFLMVSVWVGLFRVLGGNTIS